MRFYLKQNVFDAALDRVRWLFDEFKHVYVNMSGGKDSTIVMNLALMVAEEKGRLPLDVMFIDQEAEWQTVIDYIRVIMHDPRVRPFWLQVPIKIFNATSTVEPWLYCWEPGRQWVRDKEPDSIHNNTFGTDRFAEMFEATFRTWHANEPACHIAGVRGEESPARMRGLTTYETYKGETWGSVEDKRRGHYTFYPVYDWTYSDVWKAIHDNGWPYCRIYDFMYQYGVPVREMRVSNIHHETAVRTLFYLQEIESDTWERVTARISGLNTAGQLRSKFLGDGALPFMFSTWAEYRDYLLENLLTDEDQKAKLRRQFKAHKGRYIPEVEIELNKAEVQMILVNDYHGTKISTFHAAHGLDAVRYRQDHGLPLSGPLPKEYIHRG